MPPQDDRLAILRAVTQGVQLASDVDLEDLAARTADMTGADIKALVSDAQLAVAHRLLDKKGDQSESRMLLDQALLNTCLAKLRRSVSAKVCWQNAVVVSDVQ